MLTKTGRRTSGSDMRQMVRITQLYYRMHLSQEQIGERLGLSRFQVGRRLARALREDIVKIEIRHPVARLVELEDALAERFGLRTAVVVDVPTSTSEKAAEQLAREAVAGAAVRFLADLHPSGSIGVSWGRTMLELARQLEPGWTSASEVVQLNGATSLLAEPTRANEIAERVRAGLLGPRSGCSPRQRSWAARRCEKTKGISVGATIEAARATATAIFSLGDPDPQERPRRIGLSHPRGRVRSAGGGRGGRHRRPLPARGRRHRLAGAGPADRGTSPCRRCPPKPISIGVAAGARRGPIALGALRGRYINVLVADADTAQWVIDDG